MEFSLRVRFPDSFAEIETLGQMLGLIRPADQGDRLYDLNCKWYDNLEEINEYATTSHHDAGSTVSPLTIEPTELRRYVKLACKFISSH